jgi:purine-binding chemotaxis protein CheW
VNDELASASRWSTFVLGEEMFALRVDDVQEVLLLPPITPVPLAPSHVLGLVNLRGQVMAALDVRGRLACPPRKPKPSEKLLVLHVDGMLVSMVVDEIGDVVELDPERWQPIPETLPMEQRHYVTGLYPLEGKLVLGLKMPALIADEGARSL